MKNEEERVSTLNKTTIIAIALIAAIVLGGTGWWIYRPSTPELPINIDVTDNQPTQNQTETTPELTNATSLETETETTEEPTSTENATLSEPTPELIMTITEVRQKMQEYIDAERGTDEYNNNTLVKAEAQGTIIRITGLWIREINTDMPGELLFTDNLLWEPWDAFDILVGFPYDVENWKIIEPKNWKIIEPKILLLDVGDGPMSIDCKITWLIPGKIDVTRRTVTIEAEAINFPVPEIIEPTTKLTMTIAEVHRYWQKSYNDKKGTDEYNNNPLVKAKVRGTIVRITGSYIKKIDTSMPGRLVLTEDLKAPAGSFNLLVSFPYEPEDWEITKPKILLCRIGDGPMSIDCKITRLDQSISDLTGLTLKINVKAINFPTKES